MPATATATATATAEPYGVVAIRGNAVGIALDQLREVVPAPERYLPLPTAAPGLLGAIDLRGLLVPVIELDIAGTAEGTAPIIAVLHIGAGLLGLAADRVLGVERVDPSRLQPLRTAGADDCLFPCCYHDPGGHGVVSLLDGEALIERSGVPRALDVEVRTSAGDQRNGTATDDGVRSVLLAAIGSHHIAIDVQVIHNVLPELALERSILDGPACLGTTPLLQSRIPVADPLAVLRLGDLADTAVHRGIALRHERGFVAFALSDVHQIRRIALQELGPLPPIGLARPELFQGLWHGADGPPYLLVDGDRLLADPDVTAMAALNTGRPDGAVEARTDDAARLDDEAGRARAGRRYVACSIGIDVAVPIEQIDEITTFPDRLITEATSEEVIGVFLHRGLAVPLVRLAPVVGVHRPADNDADRRVIVVRHRGHTVGFVVDRLLAIARSVWEEADGAGSGHTIGTLAAGAPLVRLDATEVHGLIAHLDLPAVVDAVLAADALAADPLLGEAA